ncbi:hypothetical protein FA13DRAFT_1727330 [Coprinellus micaceus]|uniref:Uncharacterized protein n=1 Tax=Coprinellus micaceus TaxID=71717 RepID=A0A4Y7TSM1_COPMI|nr:hypothetical protein FA13DRAFT_1727330 [Coprinellus micaceus]
MGIREEGGSGGIKAGRGFDAPVNRSQGWAPLSPGHWLANCCISRWQENPRANSIVSQMTVEGSALSSIVALLEHR